MAETTAATPAPPEANYKETVESILIAFILAFIFRAFVVEAFVIPTGSMAPTLYGAHVRFQCPDCGYMFDVGARGTQSAYGDDIDMPSEAALPIDYHCPNCGYEFRKGTMQRVRFGDRILVLKYLYLFQKPVRWDVVVFKSPDEQAPIQHVPEDPEYAQNYIKRLVGIGPESLVILDGDVYTGPFDAETPLGSDGKPQFKIQRKPPYVQDALWRVVYDNDFIPHLGYDSHRWLQPWQEETPGGWKLAGPVSTAWPVGTPSRIFDFNNPSGSAAIVYNPEANPDPWWGDPSSRGVPKTHELTDFLPYDEAEHRDRWAPLYVSDLKIACDYTRRSGNGPLRLQLSKNEDLFTAEISPGKLRLLRGRRPSVENSSGISPSREIRAVDVPALAGSAPARIELMNVDYRVTVRVNGVNVITTDDSEYAPDVAALWKQEEDAHRLLHDFPNRAGIQTPVSRPIVRIEAAQQDGRIEHLTIARDIFYLSDRVEARDFWGSIRRVSHLNAGEYFTMGDNSYISGDARYWADPIVLPHEGLNVESGRVPERFMLGKAFFVYWPAGYRLPYIPINAVPDFGEMRFIR